MKRYKIKRKNNRFKVIILLLLLLSIGYAIFSQKLKVTGTVSGSARFRVYFMEAWVEDSSKGTAVINTSEGADKVTYNVTLNYPGDKCLVGTKIKNDSSIKVRLNNFMVEPVNNNNDDIKFDYIRLDTNTEILDVDGICDYEFTIEWDADSENTNPTPSSFEITLEYEQYTEEPDEHPSHNHGEGEIYTAFFDANGGTVSKSSINITYGKKYGDLPIPERTEYTFKGWYTKREGGSLITSDDVVETNKSITLYARWDWNGHMYGEYEIIKEPTCLEDGEKSATCSLCGDIDIKVIPALGHDWNEGTITIPATCTQEGVKTYTCKNDLTHTRTENIPVVEHTLITIERKEPTCIETGNIAHYKCTVCNKLFSDNEGKNEITNVIIDELGHDWDEGAITTPATCTQEGVKTYICKNDSTHTRTETIQVAGHMLTAIERVEPTCTEAGNIAHYRCTVCNKLFSDSEGNEEIENVTLEAIGHDWDDGIIVSEPTCTETGVKLYTCRNNALHTKTETIPATGHTLTSVARVEATCTETGNIAYYRCTTCNKLFSDSDGKNEITNVTISAKGHSLSLVAKVDATCTETGNNAYYKCSVCKKLFKDASGAVETTAATETIPAAGHKYGTSLVYQNSSYHAYKCTVCGNAYTGSTSHTWSGVKAYSSYNADYHYRKCTVSTCGATKSEAHSLKEYKYENHGNNHLKVSVCACGTNYNSVEENHTYNKQVKSSNYLKSSGTCKAKAVYYYSCACGQKGSSTFYGDYGSHSYSKSGWCYNHNSSATLCKYCGKCVVCGSTNTK